MKQLLKPIFFIRILNNKEQRFLILIFSLILLSFGGILLNNCLNTNKNLPAEGGTYREAILGYPHYLNPVLSYANDPDRDVVRLIYSGLTKFDPEGNIVPDLAENFNISNSGKTYEFFLRKNILWHDGKPFTAEDVIFTISIIQNAEYNSPLRFNWEGVDIEKINDWTVRFKLRNAYAPFLANTTVGILPKHIWENISSENFISSQQNLAPIGTGAFLLKQIKKNSQNGINSIILEKNRRYYLKSPYLDKIILNFYANEEESISALNKNRVNGIALSSAFKKTGLRNNTALNTFYPLLPRYFAAFFNQEKNPYLANINLRLALAYATNKDLLIKQIFNEEALKLEGPILPYFFKQEKLAEVYEYNLEKAKEYIEKVPNKDKIILTITVPAIDELIKTAEILKNSWESLGISIKITPVLPNEVIDNFIKPRNYEITIFGQVLSLDPDPFSFWHSSQKKDPGLNLALYGNKKADADLEKARQELDPEKRIALYKDFQEQLIKDVPAIFLYSPRYLYIIDKKIKGIRTDKINLPADRFANIEDWYINTKTAQ